jgi:putative hydrolase of the HAD superfamily
MDAQRELFTLRQDTLPTLDQLRSRGLRVGVLSDCTIELAEAWPSLPLSALVQVAVFSCMEGRRKPDPILFHAVAQRLDAEASDCLYISDGDGQELTGAGICNMTAVMLRTADSVEKNAHREEDDWSGQSIESLSIVPKLLEEAPSRLALSQE